jgi:hypothetical protein
MEPIVKVLEQTKKRWLAVEVQLLVVVDETLRALDGRVRGRLRKLGHGRARPAARKGRKTRHVLAAAA